MYRNIDAKDERRYNGGGGLKKYSRKITDAEQIREQRKQKGEPEWDIWRDGCPGGEYVFFYSFPFSPPPFPFRPLLVSSHLPYPYYYPFSHPFFPPEHPSAP